MASTHRTRDDGLRLEVRLLVTDAGHRRRLPLRCHVGRPGDEAVTVPTPEGHCGPAPELRAALVERVLDGLDSHAGVVCWVSRSGELEPTREDHAWWGAARLGFAAHGLEPPACYLLTRRGWVEPATGRGRTWARVRPLPRV